VTVSETGRRKDEAVDDRRAVRVLVIAQVRLYRDGLAQVLDRDPRVTVVASAKTTTQALRLVAANSPDVVVLDPGDDADGALQAIVEALPDARVLVVGVRDDEADVIALVEQGAAAFVTRDESLERFVAAVISVSRGEALCSPRMTGALLRRVAALRRGPSSPGLDARLTGRELEVARLLDQGLSNKQIANVLCIELTTVKNHVHNVLGKLEVHRRSEVPARLRRPAI